MKNLALSSHPIAVRKAAAAQYLGISETTFQKYVDDGKFRGPVRVSDGVLLYDFNWLCEDWARIRDGLATGGDDTWARLIEGDR